MVKNAQSTGKRGKSRQKRNMTQQASDYFTKVAEAQLGVQVVKEHQFHPVRKWRFDYAIPEHGIALEVEGGVWSGGRHTSPQGFIKDIEKYNTAALMGWRLFRCTPDTLITTATIEMLRQAIQNRTECKTLMG